MSSLRQTAIESKSEEIYKRLENLVEEVQKQGCSRPPAHHVELHIFKSLLALGLHIMELFFISCGQGYLGKNITLESGQKLRCLNQNKVKKYRSVFGVLKIRRAIYGRRAGQKCEYAEIDVRLQLPDHKDSYLLQGWQTQLCSQMPFSKGIAFLDMMLDHKASTHTITRQVQSCARSARAFEAEKPAVPKAKEDEIIVSSADGKGVPMRHGKKQMALVGASYAIAPYPRTKEQILLALFEQTGDGSALDKQLCEASKRAAENDQSRPAPVAKIVRASLLRDEKGKSAPANKEIFDGLEKECCQRDETGQRTHVMIADGQKILWEEGQKRFGEKSNYVEILDIIHVAEYIWKAATILQKKPERQRAIAWVALNEILSGRTCNAIHLIEFAYEYCNLTAKKREKLNKINTYLRNNAARMKYDQYLAAGYPIASGVIEGACRHVVKDRMELSGMRWTQKGAQNILSLRCISINEQWEDYMEFHIKQETNRLYQNRADNDNIKILQTVA